MTEISLIVTLNNQFTSHVRILFAGSGVTGDVPISLYMSTEHRYDQVYTTYKPYST